MRYVLQRHWWKGQIVIRWGPSSQHYDLRIQEGPKKYWHLVMNGDPRKGPVVGYEKPMRGPYVTDIKGNKVNVMTLKGRVQLKPRTPANPTKETPAYLETLESGEAEWLERGREIAKLKMGKYVLFLRRESPDSPFWEVSLSQGPKVEKSWEAEILKSDDEKQLIYGVVMKPDVPDSQGDVASREEIEEAAHVYLEKSRFIDYRHEKVLPQSSAIPVESYIAPVDFEMNGRKVPAGSWVMVTHIKDPKIWKEVKEGLIKSYSIRGFGTRIPEGGD